MTIRSDRSFAFIAGAMLALAVVARSAHADEPIATSETDPLEAKRERFRAGMERYRAGAYTEALDIWNVIYGELGPERGYRLAFNIARAYEQLAASRSGSPAAITDTSKASEHYAAYANETMRRREAGETIEPLIEKQEQEAKTHLGSLVLLGDPRIVVKIDDQSGERHGGSTVWVVPGPHVVTFRPGTNDERVVRITVDAGKIRELAAPERTVDVNVASPPPRFETREVHPFSANALYIAAGVSALTIIVPLIFRSNALSIKEEYDATPAGTNERTRLNDDYSTAGSAYYASWAIPSVAFAATLALTGYWFWKTKETRVPVEARISPRGGMLGASARF